MFCVVSLIFAFCIWISVVEETISHHNGTDYKKDRSQHTADLQYRSSTIVIFTAAPLFTFLVSVIGNSLVIYVIIKHYSMRTTTNCLIMNLAVCDLLLTLLHTPLFLKSMYSGSTWFEGTAANIICKLIMSTVFLLFTCSIFNFIVIAVDRFLAVSRPLTYKLSSRWVVKIGIPAIWLTSAFSSINIYLGTGIVDYDDGTPKCFKTKKISQDYTSAFAIAASFVVLIVLYAIICYRLWRRKIPGEVSSNHHALAIRTARKVTVLMISIVIVFFVSWMPAFIVTLSDLFDADSTLNILIYKRYPFLVPFCYWLTLNSTACNPCLYFIFIESFRQSFTTACTRCCVPKLRPCIRIGQERRFETEEQMRNRSTLNACTQNERAVELIAYSSI